jgi:hypothetical protein
MSFNMTQASGMADLSHKILPKMMPVSVEETCKWADQCLRETIEKREDLYRHFDALEPVVSNGIHSRSLNKCKIT